MEGKLFQTLSCNHPTLLTSLYIGDETILAFVEEKTIIQIYIYRGVQGFVQFSSIKIDLPITQMSAISVLPIDASSSSQHTIIECSTKYLAITVSDEIWFLEAKTKGNCFAGTINC